MNFFNKLKAHIGGLICLKTQLYWYNLCDWDGAEERVCLLLDIATSSTRDSAYALAASTKGQGTVVALLFIDGSPKWVLLSKEAVEFIQ
jgi:hypothetical protein